MALAGQQHIDIPRQPQFHRFAGAECQQRRHASDQRGVAFLAAERAAHAPHLHRYGGERQARQPRHDMLHLRRVLVEEKICSPPSSSGVARAICVSR